MLLIERGGKLLLEQRPPTGIWAGLWSLPELAVGEDIGAHCRVRYGLTTGSIAPLPPIEHGFTHYHLTLLPRRITVRRAAARVEEPGLAWFTPERARTAALPAPIRKLIETRQPAKS
jgi:A/G-specific adenine glycosylase